MTTSQTRSAWAQVDLSAATWRSRAIRYVLIYLSLIVALVAARYALQDIRPTLLAAQAREAELVKQRDELSVQVQSLENPQRIRDWAFAHGMVRFAQAPKVIQPIVSPAETAAPPKPRPAPERRVEVKTTWR